MDRDTLRIKFKLLLLKEFGDDFEPRPFQINAVAGSGKSTLLEAMNIVFGKRTIAIIIYPLYPLIEHQTAKLCMRGKKALFVSKKTWEDGTLYEQLKDSLCKVEYIFIESFKTFGDSLDEKSESALWRIPPRDPTHFAPSMLKLFNNVSELVVKLCSSLRMRHPIKSTNSRGGQHLQIAIFFAKADLFRPNLRNIVVEMTPQTKTAMTDVLKIFSVRSDPSTIV
ncbi:BZ3500_MvSof-1268-A1-R1_Chr1-3g01558 [Microbotryum saponariae]|uniref:BZ3500_MvSof-1268-A1-R1_Chr1-3g01558 protein n=1 Tax=Microbotryum saponariae TaxID=289078 RepID=A0A2X0KG41_9BASI|nr:BZ3500_MvSof-1268-A1-R1_Chr1-3g01558 [Microbotryum saponariae]SCZ94028.1 BZ3501_MvSof-1269-A2-R1_Chr1-3g01160 [Microbotryum saponariae]